MSYHFFMDICAGVDPHVGGRHSGRAISSEEKIS
jgi:hypothetical protein